MESRIISFVDNDDVEKLELFTVYAIFFQIEDNRNTILHRAILLESPAVFDFLLSLSDCPINVRNRRGHTALQIALYGNSLEYFSYALLKKGANIDCNHEHPSLLYSALNRNYIKVAKLLIEKGADLNYRDPYGKTPLHCVFNLGDDDKDELLAMMLCSGADPLHSDDQGHKPIDLALKDDNLSKLVLEQFIFYSFDDYSADYETPIDSLFNLIHSNSPLVPQVLKHVTSVNLDEIDYFNKLEDYFFSLFIIQTEYLKLLLEKFDYVIQNIIDASLKKGVCVTVEFDEPLAHKSYDFSKEIFIENFCSLLQSGCKSGLIQIIDNIKISELVIQSQHFKISENELFGLIMIMLSYGADIYDEDLEKIYEIFGYCELFKTLLYMDIKVRSKDRQRDVMPTLIYDIHMDIETFLNDPYNYSVNSLPKLLNYFADPKLINFCCSLPIQYEDIHAKVKDLPSVPLLVELARNKQRKCLIREYKIKNSMQFHTLIKRLPISVKSMRKLSH